MFDIVTKDGLEAVLNLLRSEYGASPGIADEIRDRVPCEELIGAAMRYLRILIDQQAIGPVYLNGLSWCDRTELYLDDIVPTDERDEAV